MISFIEELDRVQIEQAERRSNFVKDFLESHERVPLSMRVDQNGEKAAPFISKHSFVTN